MSGATIAIQIDPEAAKIYKKTSQKEQVKLGLLFSMMLRDFASSARSLDAIMDEVGEKASVSGLTEEKLQKMLDAA